MATVGAIFSLPLYIMWYAKPPASIAVAFFIWSLLLMFFWKFYDDNGDFCG